MTINCDQCARLISRQLDRATSDTETQAVRTHTLKCEQCRAKFNAIMRADTMLGKALQSLGLSDGFSSEVAERLARADLAETTKGIPKVFTGTAAGLGILIIILIVLLAGRSGPDIPRIGEVSKTENGIELAYFGTESYYSADMGTEIPKGAKVRSETGSGLLQFREGLKVALGPGTVLDLVHYDSAAKIILEQGEIFIKTSGRNIQVDTSGAKVYCKEAEFLVRNEGSGKTTVVVKSGEVNLFDEVGATAVSAGDKAETLGRSGPSKPAKANLKNYLGWAQQLGL